MGAVSKRDKACFETTRRLLSHLINEGLCSVSVEPNLSGGLRWLCLHDKNNVPEAHTSSRVKVHITTATSVAIESGQVISSVRPDQLVAPVLLEFNLQSPLSTRKELDPGVIFENVYPWFQKICEPSTKDLIKRELQNSAANQETWLKFSEHQSTLDISSPAISWEKTLICGHPTHPLHRTCYAQPPLKQVQPDDILEMLSPNIIFLSVPRAQLLVTGPYESILHDLLETLGVPEPPSDRIIIPTLAQQQPAILSRFSDVRAVGSDRASAQASMRTVSLRPELQFPYHLKLSLACQITSALRTITPWSALGGPEVSALLVKLLPADMWVYREVASVTGAQKNFDDAKHLTCILRGDLEFRARSQGESLIIAAALPQPSINCGKTHAEVIFGLDTVEQKLNWFRRYTACLLKLTMLPLLKHGIGLEAHGQNIVVRVCMKTNAIRGFAVRDFGGVRFHMPTLNSQGFHLNSIPAGSAITSTNLHDCWDKVHHATFQNQLGHLIVALDLENEGGWAIVRDELKNILQPEKSADAADLYGYFLQEKMFLKCFLRMKMEGKYRDYVEMRVPNVILR